MKRLGLPLLLALAALPLRAATLDELEDRLKANPISLAAKEALAEAYLHDCQLERSLELWRAIRKQHPAHPRAAHVVGRLTAQALDLDTQLEVLDKLIDRYVFDGVDDLLDAAARRAATDPQKARILFLKGKLAKAADEGAREGADVNARSQAHFRTAGKLYPHTAWGARGTIEYLKGLLPQAMDPGDRIREARRLLTPIIGDEQLADPVVKDEARLELVSLESRALTPREAIAALRDLIAKLTTPEGRRSALGRLAGQLRDAHGHWLPEAVEAYGAGLATGPPDAEAAEILQTLLAVARESRDPATLDALLRVLDGAPLRGPALAREAAFAGVEARLARAATVADTPGVRKLAADAHRILDRLAGEQGPAHRKRLEQLRGRALLLEAQKLVALEGPTAALPIITRAKDHYLAILPNDPKSHLRSLFHIGLLLERVREWETAAALYREVATRFAHTKQGCKALLKVALLQKGPLGAPLAALETYTQYAARYPAELPYRQLDVGQQLRQLGYADVLDFQKRNNLTPDGIFGQESRARLRALEETFDLIRLGKNSRPSVIRGQFVHRPMFRIARQLEEAGRDHDAVVAYRMFLNLFPTKREADDALLAIARIFHDNLLFQEALGAYTELMEDFPKGDKTSQAYIEAAECLEGLGRWDEARELYELYLKKFPEFEHVERCRERIPLLGEIQQYQDFIATNPQSPKLAEAQYQIATILYKRFQNHTKAAIEFTRVADRHATHVRAADALYTAGVAQLRAENFPAARTLFARVVADYADTRLADDAQYWVGHTHEYAARALGKLDALRIILRRRSLRERQRLLADVSLRRRYHPDAQPGPEVPEDIWGGDTLGVLASGSKRDRVNADLFRAIRAYQKVVETFKMGDMASAALLRIGTIYTKYLKDPDKGVAAFEQLLKLHPGTKEAIGALFEVGAYYLKNKNHDKAIAIYQQFVYNYRDDKRVEDAMVAIVRSFIEKKTWDKALDACRSYLNRFPEGKHATFVKNQVTWIRMYHF